MNSTVKVGGRKLRIQQKLGSGFFGVVYKVKDEASSRVYALKDIPCKNDKQIKNAIREVQTMKQVSHENVISMIDAEQFRDQSHKLHMFILTEYCVGGTLNERLHRPSTEEDNFKWIRQMAAALAFLHSRSVVHRDLKADNVLLTATEDAKLADFGLAREFIALTRMEENGGDGSWVKSYERYYMTSGTGPIPWVAPEFFDGHYTEKADVFSLGTLFFAILERDSIVFMEKAIYGAFKNVPGEGKVGVGRAMHLDPNTTIQFSPRAQGSNALQRIALDSLQYDKDDRPSAAEIHNRITNIEGNVKLSGSGNQQPSPEGRGCC